MTTTHAELCERLRQASIQCSDCGMYETSSDFDLAVSMIESQAARIAELHRELEATRQERNAAGVKARRELMPAYEARIAELEKERDALKADAERLDWLKEETCDLRCINVPTGGDDCDVRWAVVQHYMQEPCEREIGRSFSDDPRDAIDAALQAEKEPR